MAGFNTQEAKALLAKLDQLQRQQQELQAKPERFRADAEKQVRSMQSYRAIDTLVCDEVLRNKDSSGSLRGADALVRDVVCYCQLRPIADYCAQMTAPHQSNITAWRQSLNACAGGLRRLFASSAKKQDAEQAYKALSRLINSDFGSYTGRMTADAQAIEQMTAAAAWQQWNQNRTAYRSGAREVLANVSAGNVSELDKLVRYMDSLTAPIERAKQALEQSKTAVVNACHQLAAEESAGILQGVPVEEVNRDKGGFRVKTLRDSGFATMADIDAATLQQLSAVKGISPEGAAELKKIAQTYRAQTAETAKIKLSADNRTAGATALVCAIYRYMQQNDALGAFVQMDAQHGSAIAQAKETLQQVGNGAQWLFYTPEEKQAVTGAYRTLYDLSQGAYGQTARQLSGTTVRINDAPAQAWNDFSQNTVRYYNVIEALAPGRLGNDNGLYGLPEDLAQAVAREPFYSEGLRCELRRYQEWGVKYVLHQKRVLLGDEMGLGKTVQAIAVMTSLRNTGSTRFLVVCPASVLSNWSREIAKHSDLSVTVIHGSGREKALAAWKQSGGVAVTTYETTAHITPDEQEPIDCMVVDEAHYIKNAEARRSINVKKLCEKADRLLFMTGTAIENRVDEMIALIRVLQPPIADSIKSMAYMSSAPQFREAVAPVYYRRKREDVLTELPDKLESMEWCTLGKEEEQLYEAAVLGQKYADARRVSWAVDDLQQSCKANRLGELLSEAGEEGRKVIVFSFFLDTIRKISDMLGERCVGPITGSVTPQHRQELIDAFDKAPAGAVLTAQIQSGGTGLNIQSASVVILCEPQFKPSIENQAISRAYRMGQARNVLVYRLLCEDTVDEKIMDMLKEKQAVFDAFADKSTVAEETMELDEKGFGEIMREEAERIAAKQQAEQQGEEQAK